MRYELALTQTEGNNQYWTIKGLPYVNWEGKTEPDTRLVGGDTACDSVESIIQYVYSALYAEYQCSDALKAGDIFESAPCKANKFLTFNDRFGTFDIPALRFSCVSFHVKMENLTILIPAKSA